MIKAWLIGTDRAEACGFRVRARTPVLALCRALIAEGYDPNERMEVWRGGQPALCVRAIGEAAQLDVADDGNGLRFRRYRSPAEKGLDKAVRSAAGARKRRAGMRDTPDANKRMGEGTAP